MCSIFVGANVIIQFCMYIRRGSLSEALAEKGESASALGNFRVVISISREGMPPFIGFMFSSARVCIIEKRNDVQLVIHRVIVVAFYRKFLLNDKHNPLTISCSHE